MARHKRGVADGGNVIKSGVRQMRNVYRHVKTVHLFHNFLTEFGESSPVLGANSVAKLVCFVPRKRDQPDSVVIKRLHTLQFT